MKEQFITFIKKHKCYKAYKENLLTLRGYTFNAWIKDVDAKDYVQSAFRWGSSVEGLAYWIAIDDQWLKYLEDVNNQ